jgi:hypothetical protein
MTTGPRPPGRRTDLGVRRYAGPLLAYHVLIIGGGATFLAGIAWSAALWSVSGLAVLIAGLVLHVLVLYSTAKRAGQGLPGSSLSLGNQDLIHGPSPAVPSLCPTCGLRADTAARTCPRCGKFLVRARAPQIVSAVVEGAR